MAEKKQFFSFVGKEYVFQGLKLLKLGCKLKFIYPQIKYVAGILIITVKINELRKNTLVLKCCSC